MSEFAETIQCREFSLINGKYKRRSEGGSNGREKKEDIKKVKKVKKAKNYAPLFFLFFFRRFFFVIFFGIKVVFRHAD